MPNLAEITIAGHVGSDAELRYLQDSTPVCSFSVAVNDKDTVTWYRVSVWRKYGEVMSKLVKKGHTVVVIGEFQPREYTAKDGSLKASFDVQARHVVVISEPHDSGTGYEPSKQEDIPF